MLNHDSKPRTAYYLILAIAIIMIVITFRFTFIVESPLINYISFRENIKEMTISPYYNKEEDIYYLFLPSYVTVDDISVTKSDFVIVNFSDGSTDYGSELAEVPLQKNIILTLSNFYQEEQHTIQFWQCKDVPTIYLDTASGSLDNINEDKDDKEDAIFTLINEDGDLELNVNSTVSGHGNSTWKRDKKPYNIKFSSAMSFGPFESIGDVCLLSNYSDETRIRNSICYYAGATLGIPFSSPYMDVNVYANGEYLGLYGLTTKNEFQKYIKSNQINAVFEMQITDLPQDEKSFNDNFEDRVKIMYGDLEDIQYAVGQFEMALISEDWDFCHSVIDIHSFAEKYAFEEFVSNYDVSRGGGYQSKYFYLDNNNIIHCMLPWDYDLSLATGRTFFNDLYKYMLWDYRISDNLFERLMQDDEFIKELTDVLTTEFTDDYLNNLCHYVNYIAIKDDSSWQCDICRWKNETPYNDWDNSSGISDLHGYAEFFNNYFFERRDFLKECFSDFENYCKVELRAAIGTDEEYFNLLLPKGTNMWLYLDGANILNTNRCDNYEFSGWHSDDGLNLYDMNIISKDITFYGTWEEVTKMPSDINNTNSDENTMLSVTSSKSGSDNSLISFIKKIYHKLGLDAFGIERLIICGLFGGVLVVLISLEIIHWYNKKNNGQ